MNRILLGTGALIWMGGERRSDRYGTVFCTDKNANEEVICPGAKMNFTEIMQNKTSLGRLEADVLITRDSTHIGDLFHGLVPGGAVVGETVVLGSGLLFAEDQHGELVVGIIPRPQRDTMWLDPKALYRLHEQDVNLYFVPNEY